LFISLPKAIARCGAIFQAEDYNDNVLFNHPARRKRSPVASVLDTSKVEVQDNDFYDLTTEHNHNYLAGNNNFVFVHNTVLHLYMNERISSANACKNLVRRVLERYRLPYITVTPTFSICPVHGYLAGEHDFCPLCDDEKLANKEITKEITNDSKSSK
jgi:ribonucleoside-triphosphate reductase